MGARRDHPPDLRAFLWPASIAVVGASSEARRLGGRLLENLRRRAFPGALYPVNPGHAEIQGLPAYPSIGALPGPAELALVIVRAELVAGILAECAAHGVKGAVVFSSGFAEAGEAWRAAEEAIADIGARSGLMIAGPNAEGFFNARGSVGATFSPAITYSEGADAPATRKVSVVAQSGGVGFSVFNRGMAKGLGFNYVVSTGNEACLDCVDFAEFMVAEPETEVVAMFVEGFQEPRRLAPLAARAADLAKPLIVAKAGRSEAGRRAAVSHTASLAGSNAAYEAVARAYGIIGADDAEEIADIAAAFANCPPAKGKRVAVVTTSGGNGVWLADALERRGLEVPVLGEGVQEAIGEIVPFFGATANPVDVTAQTAHDGGVFRVIDILCRSDEVDMIAVPAPLASEEFVADAAEDLRRIAAGRAKPVLYYAYSLPSKANIERLAAMGIHCYTSLGGIAAALRALADYGAFQARWQGRSRPQAPDPGGAEVVERLLRAAPGILCEYEVMEVLAACGVATARGTLARDEAEALAAARRIGYPVALKVQSPDLPHKSDAGGLALGVGDEPGLRRAFRDVLAKSREARPGADVRGVLVQEMCAPGLEMLAGVVRDPDYGPLVVVGMGGLHAEAYADTAMAPAPIGQAEALDMIGRLRGAALLAGVRGRPPADSGALARLLVRLSDLALRHQGDIAELDLNPVIVYANGEGVRVVDGLMVTGRRRKGPSDE